MDQIIISRINYTSPRYQEVWDLREEILRKPLGRSLKNDNTERDLVDIITIAECNNKIVGCVLLHHLTHEEVQLRAMAVCNEWQGKGIGSMLVRSAESYAWENGYRKIVLHARKVALGFYSSLDYSVVGDEFTEVGIPHFIMEKERP